MNRRFNIIVAAIIGLTTIPFVVSASAADSLDVHLVSQNSNSITLGWTPQPGYGYLFSADGVVVSRTNDSSRSTVKFSKSYRTYEVSVIVKGASGTYPTSPPAAACSDTVDNDGDGKIDYPADPGCTSAGDTNETDPPPPATQCSDGIDNDADGKIDLADTGCSSIADNDETDSPPSGATRFVSPSGNDSGTCTQTAPCKTFQRAATMAATGETIEVAGGNYPGQSLSNIHKTLTIRAAAGAQPKQPQSQMSFFCVTGLTLDNIDAQQMFIGPGSKNLTIKNSEFGGGTWTTGVESDPIVLSGDNQHGSCSANGFLNTNILLDNIHVHDYFWNQNPGTGPHPDCLQFYGGSSGVTIRNSLFERCAESFIGAYADFGNINSVLVENTIFRDLDDCAGNAKGNQCTYYAMQWGCVGHSGTINGVTFRGTTWSPGVAVPIRTDCQNFLVENNTFQTGPSQFSCDDWNNRWNGTVVWRNNTFLNGNGCATG